MLKNKKIALYVTGGIAVYKSLYLLREIIKQGGEVRVAMTQAACQFVNPLSFQVLSQKKVQIDTFEEGQPESVSHIDLTDWADYSIVAPATANIIGKLANGIGDDFVSTALLATDHPIFLVPAMNTKMYENPALKHNKAFLIEQGHYWMEPDIGFLAEGYEGLGRFPDLDRIMAEFNHFIIARNPGILSGKKVLVTAGGTVERIDPVRYISNDSSGKMGHQLAQAAYEAGAQVSLVTASDLPTSPFIDRFQVESTLDLYQTVSDLYDHHDILMMAAAVSDYRPVNRSDKKMKKQDDLTIELEKNPDILAEMGRRKDQQINVGFAAETHNLEEYAKKKLASKQADLIVANELGRGDRGFNADENAALVFSRGQDPLELPLQSKKEMAQKIIEVVASKLPASPK